MKEGHQLPRLGNRIRWHLADILHRKVRDPRLENVTLQSVRVAPDLSVAKVHYFPPAEAADSEQAGSAVQAALEKAAGFMRTALAKEMSLRHAPKLHFVRDSSRAQLDEIDRLLAQMPDTPS